MITANELRTHFSPSRSIAPTSVAVGLSKLDNYRRLETLGCSFVANVVRTQGVNVASRLRGLLYLVETGHDVRSGSVFDELVVDFKLYAWADLEHAGR